MNYKSTISASTLLTALALAGCMNGAETRREPSNFTDLLAIRAESQARTGNNIGELVEAKLPADATFVQKIVKANELALEYLTISQSSTDAQDQKDYAGLAGKASAYAITTLESIKGDAPLRVIIGVKDTRSLAHLANGEVTEAFAMYESAFADTIADEKARETVQGYVTEFARKLETYLTKKADGETRQSNFTEFVGVTLKETPDASTLRSRLRVWDTILAESKTAKSCSIDAARVAPQLDDSHQGD